MKKSLWYEIFMTALVLVVIAGVAGALLGLVNHFTEVDEEELLARKASAVYDGELVRYDPGNTIMAPVSYQGGDILGVYVPKNSAANVYVLIAEGSGAYKGTLRLLVNITDGRIKKIAVYEANETPGLGSKALDEKFFEQYYGKKITADFAGFGLVKGQAGADEVSAVTGASKSSTAVTNAVNAAVKWYQARGLKGGEQ